MTITRAARRAAAAAAAAVGLAACGSAGPLAGLSADQVVTRAIRDLRSQPAVTMSGSFAASGPSTSLNLTLTRGRGCAGTVTVQGAGSVALVQAGGTLWVRPDARYWASQHTSPDVVAAVSGKYLQPAAGSELASLGDLCDTSQLAATIGITYRGMSKGPVSTQAGQRALAIASSSDAVYYVSDTAAPLLLRVAGGSAGYLRFRYGAPPVITAPPASQQVNGAAYGL